MGNVTEITSDLVQEAFTDALRQEVGYSKPWSVKGLAEATGIDTRTIDAYHQGSACPCMWKMLRIMQVLGPAFVNRIIGIAGLGNASHLDAESTHILAVNALASRLCAQVGAALADDGKVDHQEEAAMEPVAEELHTTLSDFLEVRRAKKQRRKPSLVSQQEQGLKRAVGAADAAE